MERLRTIEDIKKDIKKANEDFTATEADIAQGKMLLIELTKDITNLETELQAAEANILSSDFNRGKSEDIAQRIVGLMHDTPAPAQA